MHLGIFLESDARCGAAHHRTGAVRQVNTVKHVRFDKTGHSLSLWIPESRQKLARNAATTLSLPSCYFLPESLCKRRVKSRVTNPLKSLLKPLYDKLFRVVFRYRLVKLRRPCTKAAQIEKSSNSRHFFSFRPGHHRRSVECQAACTSDVKLAAASMSTATIRDTPCSCMVTPIS